jgi:hypothetical protein
VQQPPASFADLTRQLEELRRRFARLQALGSAPENAALARDLDATLADLREMRAEQDAILEKLRAIRS